ncbi:hypothetical protein, partial [Vibrio harveyi]|uniref:hypothetical protein n=1 Tax=Vibrio harveyi TaxID=669 RepID=UPI001E2F0DB8
LKQHQDQCRHTVNRYTASRAKIETQDTTCLISLLETGTFIVSIFKKKILSLVHIPFHRK